MPPKETKKSPTAAVTRPPINESSLLYLADDAVEGFQERLDQCVEWSLHGSAIRHHISDCLKKEIPKVTFGEGLENKKKNSILGGFLNEKSTLTLMEHWDVLVPMLVWDHEYLGNDETKICFRNKNNITDGLLSLIKKAVLANDRKMLKKSLRDVFVLRVTDSKITDLDLQLAEFSKLATLNLCGNYIAEIDARFLPFDLKILELSSNRISSLESFTELPTGLIYLGLSKNLLTSANLSNLGLLPGYLKVLDLSDNDIYDLDPLLDILVRLQQLTSLQLIGNPCSVCSAYARRTITRLTGLKWLDNREVLQSDRVNPAEPRSVFEPHPDDLLSTYFIFTAFRIISPPMPPKPEKGVLTAFHVEMELPLLDSERRTFLMFRRFESLEELLPMPEDDDEYLSNLETSYKSSKIGDEMKSEESDIFAHLEPKNERFIRHYQVFQSPGVQWNKTLNFSEPTIKIFCPDLTALRNVFRSTITVRLVYTMTIPSKKVDKKPAPPTTGLAGEFRVTIATIKCTLKNVDWSQPFQHFHWDDSLGTNEAIHWGDGDLSVVQYYHPGPIKPAKGKETDPKIALKSMPPENLTCHFGFGIEML